MLKYISEKRICAVTIILFCVYLMIGLYIVRDYGTTWDETIQRDRSLVAYKEVNIVLLNRTTPYFDSIPDLADFDHEYYGTFIQWPMVLIEDFNGFNMSNSDLYLMRHVITFLIVYIGYVCLYIALRKLFSNKSWIPLIVCMMIMLYPRFFANQFFDVKNMVFAGLTMIVIWSLVNVVQKRTIASYIMFAIISAIATNCRIMGVIYVAVLLGYWLLVDLSDFFCIVKQEKTNLEGKDKEKSMGVRERLFKYIFVVGVYFFMWIVINPIAWNSPFITFINTFKGFSKYERWRGTFVFMGKLISCEERPWYYLFVWFGISIPIVIIVLFIIGNINVLISIIKEKNIINSIISSHRWELCFMVLFWGTIMAVIILKSRIYIAWHHVYFAFIPFCVMAGFGINSITDKIFKKVAYIAILLTLLCNAAWIIINHPKEVSWFNIIGKQYATQFDREEWTESSYLGLKWILEQEEGKVTINGAVMSRFILPDEEQERIVVTEDNPEYYIEGYRSVIGNTPQHNGYKEVYTIKVDGYNVCSVFKKLD